MKTRTHDLTAGSIPQHMLRLAAPLILGNILQQLYNAVDAFILGRCAGGLEFAAVGIAGSVMNLFLFMITGACTGASVIFAQLFGANDLETFRREHFLSLVFGLLCTLACSAIGFLCLPLLLRVIQTPQELTGYVTAYLTSPSFLSVCRRRLSIISTVRCCAPSAARRRRSWRWRSP